MSCRGLGPSALSAGCHHPRSQFHPSLATANECDLKTHTVVSHLSNTAQSPCCPHCSASWPAYTKQLLALLGLLPECTCTILQIVHSIPTVLQKASEALWRLSKASLWNSLSWSIMSTDLCCQTCTEPQNNQNPFFSPSLSPLSLSRMPLYLNFCKLQGFLELS